MRIGVTIGGVRRRIRRRWNTWRGRLRCDGAALALFALLALGVFEPLICIIHCQFWIPFALQSYFAAHHHHHMHTMGMSDMPGMAGMADMIGMPGMTAATGAAPRQSDTLPDGCALHLRGHSGVPIPPPPSPVHEMMLPLALLVLVVLPAFVYPDAPLTGPPRVFILVPLHPPIPIAG